MKKIKYILSGLLIIAALIFNGEVFVLYLDNFQNSFFSASFSFENIDHSITQEDILEDFKSASENNQVDYFFIHSKIESSYLKTMTIFGTEKSFDWIRAKGIKEGNYRSLFMGKVDIKFKDIQEINHLNRYSELYFAGDDSQLNDFRAFKSELISKYGGGFPKKYGSDKELWANMLTVWFIVFVLILLMTLYEIIDSRKENAIRFFLGQSIKGLIFRHILSDFCILSLVFILGNQVLSRFTYSPFKIEVIGAVFLGFILINSLFYGLMLHVNFKKNLSMQIKPVVLIGVNYFIKIIFTVMALLIVSGNLFSIMEGINLYGQKGFFEKYKKYSYYNISYKARENMEHFDQNQSQMKDAFYYKYSDKSLQFQDATVNFSQAYPLIILNAPAMKVLKIEYPFLSGYIGNAEFMILAPDKVKGAEDIEQFIEDSCNASFGILDKSYREPVYYDQNLNVVGIYNGVTCKTSQYKNPIMIYYDSNVLKDEMKHFDLSLRSMMFDISDSEFNDFIRDYHLENEVASKTNVFESYKERWASTFRNSRLLAILSLFILVLNFGMDVMILKTHYRYDAIEIALKKIHGYTLFEQHGPLFVTIILSALFSLGLTLLVFTFGINFIGYRHYILYLCVLLCFCECIFICLQVKKIEKRSLVTILKGERI